MSKRYVPAIFISLFLSLKGRLGPVGFRPRGESLIISNDRGTMRLRLNSNDSMDAAKYVLCVVESREIRLDPCYTPREREREKLAQLNNRL